MAIVKLPSGRTVKIPDGLTEKQAISHIFENLPDGPEWADDKSALGDQLDTSGWGSTIGGVVGGIAGSVGGIFTSPSLVVNPITLGAAGAGAGSAIGESIEQWITGKGDWDDIGWAAAKGAGTGAIGGGAIGATAKLGAKGGALVGGALGGGQGAIEGGASGAATGAVTGALGGSFVGKGLSLASSKLGLDKPVKNAVEIAKDAASGYLNAQWLKATGRGTAGNLQQSATIWQLRRDIANKIFNEAKQSAEKGGSKLSAVQTNKLRQSAEAEADDLIRLKKAEYGEFKSAQSKVTTNEGPLATDKPRIRVDTSGKPVERFEIDTPLSKSPDDLMFAEGGNVPGGILGGQLPADLFSPGGKFGENTTGLPEKDIRTSGIGQLTSTIADFLPGIGDAKAFLEGEDAADYILAMVGIIPGADLATKPLKKLKDTYKNLPKTEADKIYETATALAKQRWDEHTPAINLETGTRGTPGPDSVFEPSGWDYKGTGRFQQPTTDFTVSDAGKISRVYEDVPTGTGVWKEKFDPNKWAVSEDELDEFLNPSYRPKSVSQQNLDKGLTATGDYPSINLPNVIEADGVLNDLNKRIKRLKKAGKEAADAGDVKAVERLVEQYKELDKKFNERLQNLPPNLKEYRDVVSSDRTDPKNKFQFRLGYAQGGDVTQSTLPTPAGGLLGYKTKGNTARKRKGILCG